MVITLKALAHADLAVPAVFKSTLLGTRNGVYGESSGRGSRKYKPSFRIYLYFLHRIDSKSGRATVSALERGSRA